MHAHNHAEHKLRADQIIAKAITAEEALRQIKEAAGEELELIEEANHTRVLRFSVPIDDKPHDIADGRPVLTAVRHDVAPVSGVVEVWVETIVADDFPAGGYETRQVQVFGTGHQIPDWAEHVGSCLDGPLVWHVYAIEEADQ